MDKLLYPTDGKEMVIPILVEGETEVKGTLFPRYIGVGGQAFESARYRLNLLKEHFHAGMISLPKGDVADSRGDVVRINPRFLSEASAPKQIDVPADIVALIKSASDLVDKANDKTITDDEDKELRKDLEKLDFYFSASRNYAV